LAQGTAILALSNGFSLPVISSFPQGPPGSGVPPAAVELDLRLGWLAALFLFISAADHFLLASPPVFPWYRANLERGMNPARWFEYAVSASLMIVLIAQLNGVYDYAALLGLFALTAVMNLCGLLMEHRNPGQDKGAHPVAWSPFVVGCVAGIVPWVVFVVNLIGAEANAEGQGVPTFVYAIVASIFLAFNSFAVNMWLQYKRVGPWRNYLFGEAGYILLSLVAKSALAWQVFAGTLQ